MSTATDIQTGLKLALDDDNRKLALPVLLTFLAINDFKPCYMAAELAFADFNPETKAFWLAVAAFELPYMPK